MSESRMSSEELIGAPRRMAVETGSLNCLGCGYEHGCSIHGCAVLKAAAELLERRRWISVEERMPEKLTPVLIRHTYKEWAGITVGYITKVGYWKWFAYFMGDDGLHYPMGGGTICPGNEYVTHWMPLPEPLKEE